MTNKNLTEFEVNQLRTAGLISENEFAYKAGDLLIAENPTTGEKRIVGQTSIISESNKRVLKG